MRNLAIALLNDENGINYNAWLVLRDLLEDEGNNEDILNEVKCTEGRYYLLNNDD